MPSDTIGHRVTLTDSMSATFASDQVISNSTSTYLVLLQRDQWYRKDKTDNQSRKVNLNSDLDLEHSKQDPPSYDHVGINLNLVAKASAVL